MGVLTAKRPLNFVIILVDDLGWTDLGCFGSRYYETPNVDRLASQGMRFTNAYAACAVCSPTRASVLTGRYPARIGVTDWIRARFQGGRIPEPGEELPEFVNADDGKDRLLHCPRNPWWMELDEVVHAFAITVHKAQGSEYPAVVMPLTMQHYLMLQRNLLYTGITRAKKLVVLVGTKKAIALAVRNNKVAQRYTALDWRLASASTG